MATLADARTLPAVAVMGLTAYAEAANQPVEAQIAVMNVIRTRAQQRHLPVSDICLEPAQFSCWNEGSDPNHLRLMQHVDEFLTQRQPGPVLTQCLALAQLVMENKLLDNTQGATHYCTRVLYRDAPPAWTMGRTPIAILGTQVFFRGIAPYR